MEAADSPGGAANAPTDDAGPVVSVIVPARDEADYLSATLAAIRAQRTDLPYETLVVDGDSVDRTPEVAREHGARVVAGGGRGRGSGRDAGARAARGDWLAFIDADTTPHPDYLETMLSFVRHRGLDAASSRCRITGPLRGKLMEWVLNYRFARSDPPILPGFNCLVASEVYEESGGFPAVPNEDTAFSQVLAREWETGVCPAVLVESSGRRIREDGLTKTALHYLWLDVWRVLADY